MLVRAITVLALSSAALFHHLHTAWALTDNDLIFTTGSNEKRWQELRDSSAAWRGSSVRAVWALEHMDAAVAARQQPNTFNDTFTAAQDTGHHPFAGDWRFGMAPILAHDHHGGSFKWVLHGDDDTVFFKEAVKALLAPYDHTLPYFISDCFFNHHVRPRKDVPACLPCHSADPTYPGLRGCPCTPAIACLRPHINLVGQPCITNSSDHWRWHGYGGAGWFLSAQLVKELATTHREAFEQCLWGLHDYGDRAFTTCLWRLGYAPTDPGPFLVGNTTRPLLDPLGHFTFGATPQQILEQVHGARGGNATCQQLVSSMLSWHVKYRVLVEHFNGSLAAATPHIVKAIKAVKGYQRGNHQRGTHHRHTRRWPFTGLWRG